MVLFSGLGAVTPEGHLASGSEYFLFLVPQGPPATSFEVILLRQGTCRVLGDTNYPLESCQSSMRLTYSSASHLRPVCLVSENSLEHHSLENLCGLYKRGGLCEAPRSLDAADLERWASSNQWFLKRHRAASLEPCLPLDKCTPPI